MTITKVRRVPKNRCDHTRFTTLVELKRNYQKVLSWLRSTVPKAVSGETHRGGTQASPKHELTAHL